MCVWLRLQVCGMATVFRIVLVPALDDGVHDVFENRPRLLVASRDAHPEMWGLYTSLNRIGQGVSLAGLFVFQLEEKFVGELLRHE